MLLEMCKGLIRRNLGTKTNCVSNHLMSCQSLTSDSKFCSEMFLHHFVIFFVFHTSSALLKQLKSRFNESRFNIRSQFKV